MLLVRAMHKYPLATLATYAQPTAELIRTYICTAYFTSPPPYREGEVGLRTYIYVGGVRTMSRPKAYECEEYVVLRTDSEGILLRILHYAYT